MAITANGITYLTSWTELGDYHLGPSDNIACPCCGLLKIAKPTAELFRAVRRALGRPIIATSGSRCERRQTQLIIASQRPGATFTAAKNAKTATHVLCVALDWQLSGLSKAAMRDLVLAKSKGLHGKPARVGWQAYGNGIIHTDYAWMLKPNPDPVNFQPGVMW